MRNLANLESRLANLLQVVLLLLAVRLVRGLLLGIIDLHLAAASLKQQSVASEAATASRQLVSRAQQI